MEPEEGMLAEAGGNSVPSQGNCAGSEGESQTPQKGKLAEGKLGESKKGAQGRKGRIFLHLQLQYGGGRA